MWLRTLVFVTISLRPQHRWRIGTKRIVGASAWEAEIVSSPEFTDSDLLACCCRAWKRLPNDTMTFQAAELAHRLARDAAAVCRHYVSNGCRQGRYRLVGDVANMPGRTLPDGGQTAARCRRQTH